MPSLLQRFRYIALHSFVFQNKAKIVHDLQWLYFSVYLWIYQLKDKLPFCLKLSQNVPKSVTVGFEKGFSNANYIRLLTCMTVTLNIGEQIGESPNLILK